MSCQPHILAAGFSQYFFQLPALGLDSHSAANLSILDWLILAYLGSQYTEFHTAGWMCWFVMSFYLEFFIWPDAVLQWIWQWVYIKFCANLKKKKKKSTKTLAMIRQVLGKKAWVVCRCLNRKVQTHLDWKRRDKWRAKSNAHSSIYKEQRNCSGRPNSQSHIQLWHFMMIEWKYEKASPQTLNTKELTYDDTPFHTSFFTMEFFTKNNMTVITHPLYLPDLATCYFQI
jgi:hypothetical protein